MKKVTLLLVVFCLSFFLLSLMSFAADTQTVNGWITDAQCGVKGASAGAEQCTKACLSKGKKMVVVTDKDEKILSVENPKALKGHEGHHVAVTGHINGDSIHVESAKML